MIVRDPSGSLPAAQVLRRSADEVDHLASLLLGLEEAVCEVLSGGTALPDPRRTAQLQTFDLLGQRLLGLSRCLDAVAAALGDDPEVAVSPLLGVLVLEGQRTAILPGSTAVPGPAGSSLELF